MLDRKEVPFKRKNKTHDCVNEKFFKLKIISIKNIQYKLTGKNRNRAVATCLCDCGKTIDTRLDSVTTGKRKSCGCMSKKRESIIGNNNKFFKGIDNIPKSWLSEYIRSAKRRNIEWNLTIEEIFSVYIKQNKKCALTGVDLFFGRIRYRLETNGSIDRIDSSKPYQIDNIQLVTKDINMMKGKFVQETFIENCKKVYENFLLNQNNSQDLA